VAWAGEAAYGDADELAAAIRALVVEAPVLRRAGAVEVVVEPPLVQLRTLSDLPPVRARALAAIVAHQSGRFFRKNGKPLVTDAVWVGGQRVLWQRRPGPPRVARAAAIEAPWVDAIVKGTRDAKLPVPTISPGGEAAQQRMNLVTPAEQAARRRQALGLTRRLAVLAMALWLGVGALYVGRLITARHRLDAEAVQLRKASDAVAAARRTIHETDAMVFVVDTQSVEAGALLRTLAGIVLALPDSSYLTSLELDQAGAGMLTGAAPRAADLLASLDRNGAAPGARLDGAPLRETLNGRHVERFAVRFGRGASR
jgi:hypothetical protein